MTAVVGISHNGRVFLGADSALSSGDSLYISRDPKVFARPDGVVAGYCGSTRFGQLLALTPFPRRGPHTDTDLWVRLDVCKALRQAARDNGYELGAGADQDDSEGLLGVDGELYVLDVGGTCWRAADPFASVGSGSAWAVGSLFTSRGRPKTRLTKALEAAERYCTSVRGPWTFAEL